VYHNSQIIGELKTATATKTGNPKEECLQAIDNLMQHIQACFNAPELVLKITRLL